MPKNTFKILIALLICNSCHAEGGFYVGIGAGYASFNNTLQNGLTFNDGTTSPQTVGNVASTVYFGYDFNRWIGIQADYNVGYNTTIDNSYTVNQQLVGASILGHLPFAIFSDSLSGLSLFAKYGLDYDVMSFTNTGNSCSNCVNLPNSAFTYLPVYGLGVEYGFTNIGIRLEWNYTGNITPSTNNTSLVNINSNLYLLSVLYHF